MGQSNSKQDAKREQEASDRALAWAIDQQINRATYQRHSREVIAGHWYRQEPDSSPVRAQFPAVDAHMTKQEEEEHWKKLERAGIARRAPEEPEGWTLTCDFGTPASKKYRVSTGRIIVDIPGIHGGPLARGQSQEASTSSASLPWVPFNSCSDTSCCLRKGKIHCRALGSSNEDRICYHGHLLCEAQDSGRGKRRRDPQEPGAKRQRWTLDRTFEAPADRVSDMIFDQPPLLHESHIAWGVKRRRDLEEPGAKRQKWTLSCTFETPASRVSSSNEKMVENMIEDMMENIILDQRPSLRESQNTGKGKRRRDSVHDCPQKKRRDSVASTATLVGSPRLSDRSTSTVEDSRDEMTPSECYHYEIERRFEAPEYHPDEADVLLISTPILAPTKYREPTLSEQGNIDRSRLAGPLPMCDVITLNRYLDIFQKEGTATVHEMNDECRASLLANRGDILEFRRRDIDGQICACVVPVLPPPKVLELPIRTKENAAPDLLQLPIRTKKDAAEYVVKSTGRTDKERKDGINSFAQLGEERMKAEMRTLAKERNNNGSTPKLGRRSNQQGWESSNVEQSLVYTKSEQKHEGEAIKDDSVKEEDCQDSEEISYFDLMCDVIGEFYGANPDEGEDSEEISDLALMCDAIVELEDDEFDDFLWAMELSLQPF